MDAADRVRLLASATAYAAGRRTYVVGAVSDVIAANAGRLDAAAREALTDAIRPAADAGDPIDAPAWTRALAALETAAPDGSDGLDGSPVDLRILLFCAFRHDMGGDAGLWTRLLDDPPEEIDGQWRAISARDLYEAGLNRSILSNNWSRLMKRLDDKMDANGGNLVIVPAAYTSQTCHKCGHVAKENRDSQAVFKCVECGYKANADVNAAKNILGRALRKTGGGTA